MTTAQLNARKFEVIKMIQRVTDEKVLSKIEALVRNAEKSVERERRPVTIEELNARIDRGEADIMAGRTISQAEIEKIAEKWGVQRVALR